MYRMLRVLKFVRQIVFFLLTFLAIYLIYNALINLFFDQLRLALDQAHALLLLVVLLAIWLFTAYSVIPRIHRLLVKLYLPDYFIGRTRTSDGLLADPVNLAILGTRHELVDVMESIGWQPAERLSFWSRIVMTWRSIMNQSYPNAPVSSHFLFNKKQDLAFQLEVEGSPRKRHHVRFWKTPPNWWLPGGFHADWVGAAIYDRTVGFSGINFQFTHKNESNIDVERDYVVQSLRGTAHVHKIYRVERFASGFRSRSGGGDFIQTDGNLPFIILKSAALTKSRPASLLAHQIDDVTDSEI